MCESCTKEAGAADQFFKCRGREGADSIKLVIKTQNYSVRIGCYPANSTSLSRRWSYFLVLEMYFTKFFSHKKWGGPGSPCPSPCPVPKESGLLDQPENNDKKKSYKLSIVSPGRWDCTAWWVNERCNISHRYSKKRFLSSFPQQKSNQWPPDDQLRCSIAEVQEDSWELHHFVTDIELPSVWPMANR